MLGFLITVFYSIGNKINQLMAKEGISGMKLAQKLGIPASTFKKIRSQEITNPTLATLVPIAQYFSVPVEYFLETDTQCDVPLVSLSDVANFPEVSSNEYINTARCYSGQSFALCIERETIFPKNSFIIVDTVCQAREGDCVVIVDEQFDIVIVQLKNADMLIGKKVVGVVTEYHRKLAIKSLIHKE
jgi:transcriptional regulator with XRE-family HTH domain